MIISNQKNQKIKSTAKVTFKSQLVIVTLLQEYINIRQKVQKLIGKPIKCTYSMQDILTISKSLPKSLERNKNLFNEVKLCEEIKEMLSEFAKIRVKHRFKPYELFMSFKRLEQILTNRMKNAIKGNFQQISNNPQIMKLFYFTKQLEDISVKLQEWAKNLTKSESHSHHHSPISFVFPQDIKKTDTNTNRMTQPSTACMERDHSKHQKRSDLQECNHRSSEYFLFRSSTAKMQRKQLKMSIRCPSAAQLLRKQNFKKPSFQLKKSYKKIKNRSDAEQFKKTSQNQNIQLFNQTNLSTFQRGVQFQDQRIANLKRSRKVSILNKSSKERDSFQEQLLSKKSTKRMQIHDQKFKKSNISNFFSHKKKQVIDFEEEVKLDQQQQSKHQSKQNISSLCDIVSRRGDRKLTNMSFKKINFSSQCNSQVGDEQNREIQDDKLVFVKEKKMYKKARRSGKVMMRENNQLVDIYMLNLPKAAPPSNFSRRRKAIMSSQKDQDFNQIQNFINNQQDSKKKKKLQFDQNVLLAVSQALKSRIKNTTRKQTQKEIINKKSLTHMFGEMNQFLKNYYIGTQPQPACSVFFQQQQRARLSQDQLIRQKMQQLMNNNHTNTNVFELHCRQFNNKDTIYNQIHRYISFLSDSQWIKHNFVQGEELVQQDI